MVRRDSIFAPERSGIDISRLTRVHLTVAAYYNERARISNHGGCGGEGSAVDGRAVESEQKRSWARGRGMTKGVDDARRERGDRRLRAADIRWCIVAVDMLERQAHMTSRAQPLSTKRNAPLSSFDPSSTSHVPVARPLCPSNWDNNRSAKSCYNYWPVFASPPHVIARFVPR